MSGPQWTQDEAIAFESAKECITHWGAILTSEIHTEAAKPNPDRERMAALEAESLKLFQEGRALSLKDHGQVDRARREYGARIREWNASHAALPTQ